MKLVNNNIDLIKSCVVSVKDFPIDGILFRDILPIFQNHLATEALMMELTLKCKEFNPICLFALDARGFLFGPVISARLGIPFYPIRKKGKLPGDLVSASYTKEYGTDTFETYKVDLKGARVVILDDLLATGGSVQCASNLIHQLNGKVVGYVFAIELQDLKAKDKLAAPVSSVLQY